MSVCCQCFPLCTSGNVLPMKFCVFQVECSVFWKVLVLQLSKISFHSRFLPFLPTSLLKTFIFALTWASYLLISVLEMHLETRCTLAQRTFRSFRREENAHRQFLGIFDKGWFIFSLKKGWGKAFTIKIVLKTRSLIKNKYC